MPNFGYYLFKYYFCPLSSWDFVMLVLVYLIEFYFSPRLRLFFFILFLSIAQVGCFELAYLQIFDSSANSDHLQNLFSEFFISVIILCKANMYICIYICFESYYLVRQSSSPTFFLPCRHSFLNKFITVDLNIFSTIFNYALAQKQLQISAFVVIVSLHVLMLSYWKTFE